MNRGVRWVSVACLALLASCVAPHAGPALDRAPLRPPAVTWPTPAPKRVTVTVVFTPDLCLKQFRLRDRGVEVRTVRLSGLTYPCRAVPSVEINPKDGPAWIRHVVAHELWHVMTGGIPEHSANVECFSYANSHSAAPRMSPCAEEVRQAESYSAGVVYHLILPRREPDLKAAVVWACNVWNAAIRRKVLEVDE